jgi:hypothetical protein
MSGSEICRYIINLIETGQTEKLKRARKRLREIRENFSSNRAYSSEQMYNTQKPKSRANRLVNEFSSL